VGRVAGIGGFFFRAREPAALSAWYAEHFGNAPAPASADARPWQQAAGPTVFAPFRQDSDYFGDAEKVWMLNLRVEDLDGLVAALRAKGVRVSDPEGYPEGRFARLVDPEGNPLELWEP
jgi:glyoxylase I family protein